MKLSRLLAVVASLAFAATLQAKTGWLEEFDLAVAKAKAENKPILINFTGSDWCGWCIKQDEETFSKAEFKDFAKDKLVLLEIDFPQNKRLPQPRQKQNDKLAKDYGVRGYPTHVLVDAEGKELGRMRGYVKGGPQGFIDALTPFLPAQ